MRPRSNAAQVESWNGDGGLRWVATADQRDRVLAPVADALLATAGVVAGEAILDIGCGCGHITLRAARDAGPTGSVLGIDVSEPMLDVARTRAAGAANVRFVRDDAQTHAFETASFDLAMSRFGTMFFDDPGRAFTNVAAAIRTGGRLCLATWRPLPDNEWLVVPGAALLRHATLPPGAVEGPGMFAQSDPSSVRATLDAAGFSNVSLEATDVTFTLGETVERAVDYLADGGPGRALLESITDAEARETAIDDVRSTLAPHLDDTGVHLGGAIWIIRATR